MPIRFFRDKETNMELLIIGILIGVGILAGKEGVLTPPRPVPVKIRK
jgi:hypothetical protein